MITLKPITAEQTNIFEGFSYESISDADKIRMLNESRKQLHEGNYFELLVVYFNDKIIGFMNLYAHSAHIISCAPEIMPEFRRKGFAFEAEKAALDYAKEKGYNIAVGYVDENNIASQKLHEKLAFESDYTYVNKNGKTIKVYIKAL